ncbi:hypothetical protein PLESTB_000561500 [Pleodorina starrii]|uniref:Uncharacterized protein n=1 Tax=Pleodorina starrii TaxID=330485 RepID=A0A9W6BI26_9CHLO|nr:hypothetical protein PLESTM_000286600 [Pleodorina starrii]GLC51906.1 hypothetical protein PLESTB_000561500 [Pleodorina starrii]GLC74587.1 hypothetical protein PLESTF_001530300 [Pleodorina starrii]
MKPTLRVLRDVVKPRVSLPSLSSAAAPGSQDQRRSRVSEAFQLTTNLMNAGNGLLLNEFQWRLVKRATAGVTDALLGPAASPSLRLLLRRALRAAVAMASTAAFLLKLWGLAASLDHLDFAHDMKTDAELASAVDTILHPAIPPTLLVRATLFTISVLTYWMNLSSTTDSLVHLNAENLDLITGAASVLDLAISGPGLMENGKGLLKFGAVLGAGRDAESGSGMELAAGGGGECAKDP